MGNPKELFSQPNIMVLVNSMFPSSPWALLHSPTESQVLFLRTVGSRMTAWASSGGFPISSTQRRRLSGFQEPRGAFPAGWGIMHRRGRPYRAGRGCLWLSGRQEPCQQLPVGLQGTAQLRQACALGQDGEFFQLAPVPSGVLVGLSNI